MGKKNKYKPEGKKPEQNQPTPATVCEDSKTGRDGQRESGSDLCQRAPFQEQSRKDNQKSTENKQQGGQLMQQRNSAQLQRGQAQQQREKDQNVQNISVQRSQQGRQMKQQKRQVGVSAVMGKKNSGQTSCTGIVRGTRGTPGTVEVNYLKLLLDSMPNKVYHYDITITPVRSKQFVRLAFQECKQKYFHGIEAAFDGKKSCYTPKRLSSPINCTVKVSDSNSRTIEFQVEIKETLDCEVDLNSLRTYHNDSVSDKPMRALQALYVILSESNHEKGLRVGRAFFCRPIKPHDLGDGYEAWTGLFEAVILGDQPFLNVDITHKSFPCESSLIDYLKNQKIGLGQDLRKNKQVQSYLRGINIVYQPPESFKIFARKYKVLNIGNSASQLHFINGDGLQMTVAEYFKSRGYSLKYPNLSCVEVGSTAHSIYLPMELCKIAGGQVLNRKDESTQVRNMIRSAATSTNVRKRKIMDMLQCFNLNASKIVQSFGIKIDLNFIKVPIRVLPSPIIEYLNGQTVNVNRGAWMMDKQQFLICTKPQAGKQVGHKWAIIYQSGIEYIHLDNFKKSVLKKAKDLNMHLENTAEIMEYTDIYNTLLNLAKSDYALVFVVLGRTAYYHIKQVADLKVGVLTQCIQDKTVKKIPQSPPIISNLLLGVNGKLNGTNHKILLDNDDDMKDLMAPIKNVMFMGADVTHPSPDQPHIPSVVGVTASHDPIGACYNMQYRLQQSTKEDIEDMESITNRHLEFYFQFMKTYPTHIIYYRDGVSDGQFPIIQRVELSAIQRACRKMGCDAKLTCIIAVKRHHTRFFPMKQQRGERDLNNVEPGTVVDQMITHPREVQFFMVSHQSIQSTAKPTRYNVILNESNFDIDLLQQLTYNLCHLFPRCNRSVSYPAPVYLAHVAAFRARVYLEGTKTFSEVLGEEYEKRLIQPRLMERNPMFFI
ncbi:protein argonaute-2 isoform X2 [Musca domestica]|uniref:Protein argonaute-2 isoform X2 n=1 Tax=Musca domestica TaxID=7370 RepID=A0ABM3VJ38_MUSDO|nr:protein argonaute-2 isoform X2 [Musca domestica]